MRSLSGPTAYDVPSRRAQTSSATQSARGPRCTCSTAARGRTTTAAGGCGSGPGRPTASTCPAARRGGPTQARVSVDREPSTGATSIPPATAT